MTEEDGKINKMLHNIWNSPYNNIGLLFGYALLSNYGSDLLGRMATNMAKHEIKSTIDTQLGQVTDRIKENLYD